MSGWLAEAMVVLADADEGAALEAEVLADFEPEADVGAAPLTLGTNPSPSPSPTQTQILTN